MESDSDSDGSHVSATPPRDPSPRLLTSPPHSLPPHHLRSSNPYKFRVSPKPSPTPVSIPRTKPPSKPKTKPKPKPKPKLQDKPHGTDHISQELCDTPAFPSVDLSNLPDFSVRIQKSSTFSSAPTSSFASVFKSRRNYSDPLEFEKENCGAGDCSGVDTSNLASECTNNTVKTDSHSGKRNDDSIIKTIPNWIGGTVSKPVEEPQKRFKFSNEGNFVRLNINGYGRKHGFRNWKRKASTYSGTVRYGRKWKRNAKGGKEEEGGAKYLEEDGLVISDHPLAQREDNCDFNPIDEFLAVVQEDPSDEKLRELLKLTHGYDSFRDGQLEAIKRVIAKQSTMLVLPTGSGKSLCYQLSTLVLRGLTLVVGPLIALMVDQLKKLPPMISGGLLCGSQTSEEANETLERVREGSIKVLYISPERFSSPEFISFLGNAPPVSLLVIDEAHCLSEWSHNFRPSYLRLKASILRTLLQVDCFLAMTATATVRTLHDIMSALEIEPVNLIQTCQIRDNLQLHVTWSENRLKDLMKLMKSSPFCEMKSIIIYCKFQSDTDMISKHLRDNKISSKSYHSGIPAKDRNHIQELFSRNKIKVVVATVAFGMGLDKSDIGAVIHYSLPESLEGYVQETGRAGRDGTLSHCHLFLDERTYYLLRSFSYSDGTDEYAINKLLCEIFKNDTDSAGQLSSMVKESASRRFDMKEEVILTILTQLEIGEVQYIILYPEFKVTCSVYFHKTSPPLLANKDILVAAIIERSELKRGHYVFDLPTIANSIRAEAMDILNQLQNLKFVGEITYDIKDPAFCYRVLKKPEDICDLTANITRWLSDVQSSKVQKLDAMFNIANHAVKDCKRTDGCSGSLHTMCMRQKIEDYFCNEHDNSQSDLVTKMQTSSPFLRADIKVFLQSNSFVKFTPRAVARIMHGISSPAFPTVTWSKCHFWGRYSQIDFSAVVEAARLELMNFVGKGET